MNENALSLAALNVSLLEAIKAGPVESAQALADRAGIANNNLTRKLDSLYVNGLISKIGDKTTDVEITEAAEKALAAITVWRGEGMPRGEDAGATGIVYISFGKIFPWSGNPRTVFDPAGIEDLARSIAEQGVLQPITVRPMPEGVWTEDVRVVDATGEPVQTYEVIMGERRRRAARLAVQEGWIDDDDFLIPCQVRDYTDDDALDVAGIENLQRDDLHWMDEANYYARLAQRGRTAAQIAAIAGGERSKRHVQTYIKIARELGEEDKARCYLPEGDPKRLLYVQARDLVGDKKEKPALAVSPKVAIALLEGLHAGLRLAEHEGMPRAGQKVTVRFFRPYSGGAFATLVHDLKLMTEGFRDFGSGRRDPVGILTVTDDVLRWLKQVEYDKAPELALRKVRAAVMGDMIAAQHHRDGTNVSAELNDPGPDPLTPAERRTLREIAARSLHRHRQVGLFVEAQPSIVDDPNYTRLWELEFVTHKKQDGAPPTEVALSRKGEDHLRAHGQLPNDAMSRNSCATPWLREPDLTPPRQTEATPGADDDFEDEDDGEEAADIPDYLRRLAGGGAPAAAQPAASPAPAAPSPTAPSGPPPLLACLLVEIAHRIAVAGVERTPQEWGAVVMANHYLDDRGAKLVQQFGMIRFAPQGPNTLVCLTPAGQDWLTDEWQIEFDLGRPDADDAVLARAQAELIGSRPSEGRTYTAAWLEPPPTTATADAPDPAQPTAPGRPQTPLASLPAPTRALLAADSLLDRLDTLLQRLATTSSTTAAQKAEIAQHRTLIANTRDAARPHLPEGV